MRHQSVLLVNPNRMRPPVAPLGLEYIAASLRRHGYEPRLSDLAFAEDWQTTLTKDVANADPVAVAVSIRNIDDAYFASQDFVLEPIARVIRQLLETAHVPVILGGVGFSSAPREILQYTGAPYGIVGDGEDALPELLNCLVSGGDVAKVSGAVYQAPDGIIRAVPPARYNLESMPTPSRRFVDNVRYFLEGGQAGLETKRGCGMPCVYCIEPVAKGRQTRLRLPQSVVEECADLLEQGVNVVHLCDSEFNLPCEHAHAICEALCQSGLASKLQWYTYAYPQPFDADLARAMASAGCLGIDFGIDHCDRGMLRRLGRSYSPEDIRRVAQVCRDAGITVMFDMLLGGPGETCQTLGNAIQFLREVGPDCVGLSCGVRVYPNTPLAGYVRRQGPIQCNPNLRGILDDNEDFLRPVFYVDGQIGDNIHRIVGELVAGDKRFFHAAPTQIGQNYNYNDNSTLAQAIRAGARGAYWDILRRLDVPTQN